MINYGAYLLVGSLAVAWIVVLAAGYRAAADELAAGSTIAAAFLASLSTAGVAVLVLALGLIL